MPPKKSASQAAPVRSAHQAAQLSRDQHFDDQHPEHDLESAQLRRTQDALDRHVQDLERREAAVADAETALNVEDSWREQAGVLKEHVSAPYFGCLLVRVAGRERRLYIGRESWSDLKGHEVVSWAAPIGAWLSGAQTEGPLGRARGEVLLKRHFDIPNNQAALRGVADAYVRAGSGAESRLISQRAQEHASQDQDPQSAPALDAESTTPQATEWQRAPQDAAGPELNPAQAQLDEQGQRQRDAQLRRALQAQGGAAAARDIIATLQPEQDLLIRQLCTGLIVQGPAGSGKTAVLTHRARWLTASERLDAAATPAQRATLIDADDITIVVPNGGLAASVSATCRALGMTVKSERTPGLRVWTDSELTQSLAGTSAQVVDRTGWLLHAARLSKDRKRLIWARAKVLGDWRLHECLRRMLIRQIAAHIEQQPEVRLEGERLVRSQGQPPLVSHGWAAARLLELGALSTTPEHSAQAPTPDSLRRALALEVERQLVAQGTEAGMAMTAAQRWSERVWKSPTPMMEIKRIEHDPEALAREVEDVMGSRQANLLRRPDPRAAAPVPREGWIDHLDLGALLSLSELLGHTGRKSPTEDPGGRRHLMIDEAQDLSSLLIYGLARRWKGLTLAGDLSQGISGHRGVSTWKQAAEAISAARQGTRGYQDIRTLKSEQQLALRRDVSYGELTRCYRSTRQITEAAWPVAAPWAKDRSALAFERQGPDVRVSVVPVSAPVARSEQERPEPVSSEVWDELARSCAALWAHDERVLVVTRGSALAEQAAAALLERNIDARAITGGAHRGAATTSTQQRGFSGQQAAQGGLEAPKASALRTGISVMDVITAKGLEAGSCVVFGADTFSYAPETEHDARLLYVAMTRGMHRLHLIARQAPHPLLAHISQGPAE